MRSMRQRKIQNMVTGTR